MLNRAQATRYPVRKMKVGAYGCCRSFFCLLTVVNIMTIGETLGVIMAIIMLNHMKKSMKKSHAVQARMPPIGGIHISTRCMFSMAQAM